MLCGIVTVRLLLIRLSNIYSHHPCLALRREASRFYYIFIEAQELGSLLAQQIDGGKEQALYYLSRRLIRAEYRYPAVEKICLALVFAAKKLRHYMLAHKIHLISRANPLKYLISQPTMSGRAGKWSLMLMEIFTFVPQKAVKGQALADFLAAHPVPDDSPLAEDVADEEVLVTDAIELPTWQMYFDGASRTETSNGQSLNRSGVGIVFVTPQKGVIYQSCSLIKECSNNQAPYEALITGLEIALDMGISTLKVFGDSQLVIRQMNGIYEVRKPELQTSHQIAVRLMGKLYNIEIRHVTRGMNRHADALAKLATALHHKGHNESLLAYPFLE